MNKDTPFWKSWHYLLLWATAVSALVGALAIMAGLLAFRAQARNQVRDASSFLSQVEIEDFELPVTVDETLDLAMIVPFSDTFEVPIQATVPVSTSILFEDNLSVPINTVIPVNTTVNVPVDIPVVGRVAVPIPIFTDIPVNLNVSVPIRKEIPVRIDIPVDLLVDVPIQSSIPVNTQVPVQMEFPVTIPLDEMGFQRLLIQVQEALTLLGELLGASS